MILLHIMSLEKILAIFCVFIVFTVACTSIDRNNAADSCLIFKEKKKLV